MTSRTRILLACVLLIAGAGLWWTIGRHADATLVRGVFLVQALVVALVPYTRNPLNRALDRCRRPSPRARRITAAAIAVIAIAYIAFQAWEQERDLIPKFHDEHMHLLQMRMLAHGKLWMPQHPLADFFESFHVFVKPVYASVYFPGTALLYVPGVWLGLPFWMMPLLVAGACCALMYLIVTELIDGVAGMLASLMLLSLPWFRYLAMMVMSHSVMLLLGLFIIYAFLRRRPQRKLLWAAVIGAAGGLAAITRPVDALCYSIPVGVAMLIALRHEPWPRRLQTLALIAVCAMPFLSLQIIQNIGITGRPFTTPYRLYCDMFTPQMSFGFHRFDSNVRPQTNLPQRQNYYDLFTRPAAEAHTPSAMPRIWWGDRLPSLASITLPNRLMLILIPLALLAVRGTAQIVTVCVLFVWIGFYSLFAYLLPVYCVVIAPIGIILPLLGADAVARLTAESRARWISLFLTLAVTVLTIAALPEFDRTVLDDQYPAGERAPSMWFSYVEIPRHIQPPAIMLFRYHPTDSVHEEPVYNIDVPWPDDAPIIRAHDLGPQRNQELFAYYAASQPQRIVYLFDRREGKLRLLGNVAVLAGAK